MILDDVLEHVPDLVLELLDCPLRTAHVGLYALVDEPFDYEGLEQLQRHLLGQAALGDLQRGTDDYDRTAGIVDPLAQQVLPEAALLASEEV